MAEQMVERVAKALAKADGRDPDQPAWVRYPGGDAFGLCWRDQYADKARAAIEAMREPTPEMLKVAGKWWEATLHNSKTGWENGEIIYLAMIDAALKED